MYHAGLEGLIGLPSPDIVGKMLWEHTQSWYASISFDCWYIPGGTTAAREYSYVDGSATETSCQNGLRDEGHNGWSIRDIMERNMDVIKEAKLQLAEVFALRLYTGPMYLWFVFYSFCVNLSISTRTTTSCYSGTTTSFVTAEVQLAPNG